MIRLWPLDAMPSKVLVPLGGGKDSIVAHTLVAKAGADTQFMYLGVY